MADVKIKPGRVSALSGSMAKAMDEAFKNEWRAVKGGSVPSLGEEDRQILFVAIAQGLVAHLQQQVEAIHVEVDVDISDHHGSGDGHAVEIKADGLMSGLTS